MIFSVYPFFNGALLMKYKLQMKAIRIFLAGNSFRKRKIFGVESHRVRRALIFPAILLFLALCGQESFAQGIGISESSITPDAHAILELRSTLRGFLAPRMTTIQRGTLGSTSPAAGMLVYDTDTKSFWFYDNGGWNAIAAGTNIGTVTSVSTAAANNGVTATWTNATTTPALTIGLGAITPTTINGLTITPNGTNTLNIAAGKTLAVSNSLTLAGTDASTLNIGTGGTLGSNAFSSTVYAPLASPAFTGTVTIPAPFTLGAVSMTSTGAQLNYLNAATGTTGTTNTNLVFSNSPTLVTPALGTPSALIGTNITGTAANFTAGSTNNISGGSGGTIPYQSAAGTTAMLANGAAGQVLKSNGGTLAPSWTTPTSGTVTLVSTAAANNGITATWSNPSSTPALTIGLGAITPASVNGLTLSALSAGFSVTGGSSSKTLTINNTLGFSGTDASTLNIGTGGTLGSNAFSSTAFAPLASPTFTGTVTIPTPFTLGSVSLTSTGTQLNYLNAATGTTGSTNSRVVFSNSPQLVTPDLGTPSALVGTNITGTAANLTAGTASNLAGGNGGTIPYQSATGATAMLANGTAGQVLQSNGSTLAPGWVTPTSGTVTSVSTAAANNGVTATWSMASPTPALTIGLGAITPSSVNGLTLSSLSTGFSVTGGSSSKTLTISNTLGFSGNDASTLNIGTGGTLGSNAFSSIAFAPLASPTFTGTVTIPTPFTLGSVSLTSTGTQLNYLNAATGTTGSTNSRVVFSNSPQLVTPDLGTPSTLVGTNISGTAANLTAGTASNLAGGNGGTIPYQSATGTTAMLANGTAGQVLQSNGTTAAPSWENAATGDMTLAGVQTVTGAKTFGTAGNTGKLIIAGATSGNTILNAASVAGAGTVTLPLSGTLVTAGTLINVQVIQIGISLYTPTPGARSAYVYLIGGGGGGGVGGSSNTSNRIGPGSGGGSGSLVTLEIPDVTIAANFSVAVGTGGVSATVGNPTTITVSGVTTTAPGGGAGNVGTSTSGAVISIGGAGGAIGTNGTVNGEGVNGQPGIGISATIGISGNGGESYFGGGGLGRKTHGIGNAGTGFGAGGGGGLQLGTNATVAGGAGANGLIIIYEYK